MKKNKILNIGSGYYQVPIIKECKKMGYEVISCDINPNAPGLKYADKKIIVDCHNHIEVFKKIKKYKEEIIGVVSGASRGTIYTTAYIAKKLNLNGLNLKTASSVINKNYISKKFNKKIYLKLSELKEINKNNDIKKIVIKSNNISGQNGIKVFKNYIKYNKKINKYFKKFDSHELNIEKYIDGKHFVVTGLSFKNNHIIYLIMFKNLDKNLKTNSLSTVNKFISIYKNNIIKYTISVLNTIKLNNYPFQIEIFMDQKKNFYVGEIELAITGSYISEKLIPYATGRNFIKECINFLISSKVEKEKIRKIKNVKAIFKNKIKKKYLSFENCKYAYIKLS